jgi:hypothetical protein
METTKIIKIWKDWQKFLQPDKIPGGFYQRATGKPQHLTNKDKEEKIQCLAIEYNLSIDKIKSIISIDNETKLNEHIDFLTPICK